MAKFKLSDRDKIQSVRRQLHIDATLCEANTKLRSGFPMFVERDVHFARPWQGSGCPTATSY